MANQERHGLHATLHERLGRAGDAIYMFGGGLIAIAISGVLAHLFERPLLFPSLGPTAILFFETPMAANASPRNTLVGHAVGIAAGLLSLILLGIRNQPSVLQQGVTNDRIVAAALSLGLTGAVLVLLSSPHPPAGATTMIVSLGLLTSRSEWLSIAAGVVILTAVAWLVNRLVAVPVPLWPEPSIPRPAS